MDKRRLSPTAASVRQKRRESSDDFFYATRVIGSLLVRTDDADGWAFDFASGSAESNARSVFQSYVDNGIVLGCALHDVTLTEVAISLLWHTLADKRTDDVAFFLRHCVTAASPMSVVQHIAAICVTRCFTGTMPDEIWLAMHYGLRSACFNYLASCLFDCLSKKQYELLRPCWEHATVVPLQVRRGMMRLVELTTEPLYFSQDTSRHCFASLANLIRLEAPGPDEDGRSGCVSLSTLMFAMRHCQDVDFRDHSDDSGACNYGPGSPCHEKPPLYLGFIIIGREVRRRLAQPHYVSGTYLMLLPPDMRAALLYRFVVGTMFSDEIPLLAYRPPDGRDIHRAIHTDFFENGDASTVDTLDLSDDDDDTMSSSDGEADSYERLEARKKRHRLKALNDRLSQPRGDAYEYEYLARFGTGTWYETYAADLLVNSEHYRRCSWFYAASLCNVTADTAARMWCDVEQRLCPGVAVPPPAPSTPSFSPGPPTLGLQTADDDA